MKSSNGWLALANCAILCDERRIQHSGQSGVYNYGDTFLKHFLYALVIVKSAVTSKIIIYH